MIDRIVWANGWPEIGDGSPSSTRPALPEADVPVRVSLTADGAAALPATGGLIDATMIVEAPDDRPYSGQVWVSAAPPGGSEDELVFGPIDVDLGPGESTRERITYEVPATAPDGTYGLYAFAGTYPEQTVEFGAVTAVKSDRLTDVSEPIEVVRLEVRAAH